jgi:predicted O-methyltransferase YrrM
MKAYTKPSWRSQMLRDFKDKLNRRVFKKFEMPWMKSKELDIITEVVTKLQPKTCFEWGSGFSTLMIPSMLPEMTVWYSLEHHKEWYGFIARENKDPRVKVVLVEPDDKSYHTITGKYNPKKEGLYDDFKTYIEYPVSLQQKFDFIFIDGRARKECLKKAFDLLTDTGVVIVHDANRDDYFSDLPPFSDTFRLTDYRHHRKQGGIWLGRKTRSLNELLDTDHHQKVWKQHDRVAKSLFLR